MISFLTNRRGDGGANSKRAADVDDGLSTASFHQGQQASTKNNKKKNCFRCGKPGHIAKDCREEISDDNESGESVNNTTVSQSSNAERSDRVGWTGLQTARGWAS